MKYMIAACSDAGIRKPVNEDALLVKIARTAAGDVCFSAVCDGMGGLNRGEFASAAVIRAMAHWFEHVFPKSIQTGIDFKVLKLQWESLVLEQNLRMHMYAREAGIRMGTTAAALLIAGGRYYAMNVGDSRIYMLTDRLKLLTKDHTFVQYAVDSGAMTPKEAAVHPKRSILLQCIGASDNVVPDFFEGDAAADTVFMLCSDGFRHKISEDEIYARLRPDVLRDEAQMEKQTVWLTGLNKARGETDNISAALVKLCQEADDDTDRFTR